MRFSAPTGRNLEGLCEEPPGSIVQQPLQAVYLRTNDLGLCVGLSEASFKRAPLLVAFGFLLLALTLAGLRDR